MAITFFGAATNPADNSNATGPSVTLTPPASMADGDLVCVSVRYRDSAATIATTPSNDGGQIWSAATQYNATNIRARVFWCRFNGTWSANPAFTVTAGANNMDAQMLVFRPTSTAYTWTLESGPNGATYVAPGAPFTVSITGRTTTAAHTVSLACFHSVDDNSWSSLAGTGWSQTSLGAQYRNNGASDNSSAFAYNLQSSPATLATVSLNQSALGGDAGSTALFTFAEIETVTAPPGASATGDGGSLARSFVAVGLLGLMVSAGVGVLAGNTGATQSATATPVGASASVEAGTPSANNNASVGGLDGGVANAVAGAATPLTIAIVTPSGAVLFPAAGTASAAATPSGGAAGLPEGVAGLGQAGSLAISIPRTGVVGLAATAAAGTLIPSAGINARPLGVQAMGAVGDLLPATPGSVARTPAGVSANGAAGTAGIVIAVVPIGASAQAIAGTAAPIGSIFSVTTLTVGVAGALVAETLASTAARSDELDGVAAFAFVGGAQQRTLAFVPTNGAQSTVNTGVAGAIVSSIRSAVGVSCAAESGTAVGSSIGQLFAIPATVAANALVGAAAGISTCVAGIVGVSCAAAAGMPTGNQQTIGAPLGVQTFCLADDVNVGHSAAGLLVGVQALPVAGAPSVPTAGSIGWLIAQALVIEPELHLGQISVLAELSGSVVIEVDPS